MLISKFLKTLACGLFAAALFPFAATADEDAPPNIVFIISDDQAYTDYGFMKHPIIKTPNLDKLAASSAWFPRGYVPTALCRPSLMTLATGLYASQHKTSGNDPAKLDGKKDGGCRLPEAPRRSHRPHR